MLENTAVVLLYLYNETLPGEVSNCSVTVSVSPAAGTVAVKPTKPFSKSVPVGVSPSKKSSSAEYFVANVRIIAASSETPAESDSA